MLITFCLAVRTAAAVSFAVEWEAADPLGSAAVAAAVVAAVAVVVVVVAAAVPYCHLCEQIVYLFVGVWARRRRGYSAPIIQKHVDINESNIASSYVITLSSSHSTAHHVSRSLDSDPRRPASGQHWGCLDTEQVCTGSALLPPTQYYLYHWLPWQAHSETLSVT